MKFAIRDDDTSFFTRPEQLVRAYEGIWERVPVSLAVVPFHGRTRTEGIPQEYWSGGSELYPLAHNKELTAFLQEQRAHGRVSIMLHGYSHVDEPDGYEFRAGADLHRKAREGKQYLEEVFEGPVHAFVPPHNALSARGYAAVVAAGLDIVQIVPFRRVRPRRLRDLPHMARVVMTQRLWHQPYPHVLDFGTHREVAHRSLTPSVWLARRLDELEFCHRRHGVYVLATHHWEFGRATRDGATLREALERLVERASALGAQFCTVNQVLGREASCAGSR
jgi:peptidoglycan/xylan/chitin deacetylase (PgdA/CDA1 family)